MTDARGGPFYAEIQGGVGVGTALAVVVVLVAVAAVTAVAATATGADGIAAAAIPSTVAGLLAAVVAVPTFRVRVDERGVHYRYWPIHRRTRHLPPDHVVRCEVGTPRWPGGTETPLGWGIAYWRYWLWPRSPGVRIHLLSGERLFLCTHTPGELCRAVDAVTDDGGVPSTR